MERKYVYVVSYFDCYEVDIYASAESAILAGQQEVEFVANHYKDCGNDEEAERILNEWNKEVEEFGAEYSVEDVVWCRKQRVFD